uniref:RNA-directed RNA polymerase n=1 Tax=Leviviridae sp. TaxID=2027243 RepID=A0A514D2L1_9VIRU|nr:MAG: RNA-dependent RNA polymerase [Leviviridae sp.]
MKSQLSLWRRLADELAGICHTSTARDYVTVSRRVKEEGVSFLTLTLPAFCKDFERSLDQGRIADDAFPRFKRDSAGRPLFLGGFLQLVFDDKKLLRDIDETVIDAVYAVRQLTGMFGKVELDCSLERQVKAFHEFFDTDHEIGVSNESTDEVFDDFARIATLLFSSPLAEVENAIFAGTIKPKHGPGSVADRLRGNAKFDLSYWPDRLESTFSYAEWGIPNTRYYARVHHVNFADRNHEIPSRVLMVPKTLKGPRIIAAEPTALQWMQQAIAGTLVPAIESSWLGDMIGFTDQLPNRRLACKGSLDGSLATLDMSEASDRISLRQALALGKNFPLFREALTATRSQFAEFAHPKTGFPLSIRLNKFASMGSALCFPIEAMAFLTAIFIGIERYLLSTGSRSQLTRKQVNSFRGQVRVYGDDIIIPVDCVNHVVDVFARLGWKTNVNKSFWTGMFRESCGGDYFAGTDVTIIRYRKWVSPQHGTAQQLAGLSAFRNQLYWRGLWKTCNYLDSELNTLFLGYYPTIGPSSPLLGRETCLPVGNLYSERDNTGSARQFRTRFDGMHRTLVRGYVLTAKIPHNEASDVGSLLKCLLSSQEDPKHLTQSGRPLVVDMKLRWSTPF